MREVFKQGRVKNRGPLSHYCGRFSLLRCFCDTISDCCADQRLFWTGAFVVPTIEVRTILCSAVRLHRVLHSMRPLRRRIAA